MSRNEYRAANPRDTTTFSKLRVQRSATGLFAGEETLVGVFDVDTTNEATIVLDTAGTLTSYYRHRGEHSSGTPVTEYSDAVVFGDYWARQQIKHDIPDADIVNGDWDSWRDQTFLDMQAEGLGRPADVQTFAPSASTDTTVGIRADIRRIDRVEIHYSDGQYWTWIRAWEQRGRTFRLFHPKQGFSYNIYGTAELRDLSDMDDELWMILYWGMRWRYLLFRTAEYTDFRPFLSRTKQSGTPALADFKRLAEDAHVQYDLLVGKMLQNAGVPEGGMA